jgi:hypothetical protein
MTEEQKYIVQGRAREEARKLKSEVATLRTFFQDYSERLEGMQNAIKRFLENPAERVGDRPVVDHLNALQRKFSEEGGFFDHTAEYIDKRDKLRKLEEQIKDF